MIRAKVSVVMPVRNMVDFLPAAILSITRQSYPVDEILVVDDGSTDGTSAALAQLAEKVSSIRVIQGPRETPSAARNSALRQVRGDVIAFLDADDLWPAGKLQLQIERLHRTPAVDAVWGKVRWFDRQHPRELRPADDARQTDALSVNLGAGVIRPNVLERIGELDASLTYSEDIDFMLRMRDFDVPLTVVPDITLFYRRHKRAMTAKLTDKENEDYRKVILRSAARRFRNGKDPDFSPKGVLSDLVEEVE